LTFKGCECKSTGDAVVRVTIEDLPVLRVDVELYGIPYDPAIGHEVTVNFLAPEIDNAGVFYTDANGLAMQRRVLNYRPTWDLDLTANQNITANYYPVGSAIAIRDDSW
jgi:lysosomal alpha-mannosidase